MSKKVSITLPDHVYKLALRKSKLTHGENNFSGYLRELVCNEFTEDELEMELIKLNEPLWLGITKTSDYNSTCQVCTNAICPGEVICYTNLGFKEDCKNWVHQNCCRKD
ncbi:hypothetical protein [Clostridium psychrophilum]|uniref:hypothetical protein n=1 Tax=Clostridium psychrophilum TaxID=132926 RepID=UPI001C0E8B8A|nr:hypothetical protein [Clostridium psychrophilum]MBU3182110.1 hypothetical protein [Clostridium psychrophilum]